MSPSSHDANADDHELMRGVRRADQLALKAIYDRHSAAIYGLARKISACDEIAEEVIQDVILRLWNDPDRFDASRGSLRSFLFRETQSRSIERIRSEDARHRREERYDREADPMRTDIEEEAWELIRAEHMKDALAELSAGERDAITLAYFGGHSYREVATLLGQSEGTVKSRIRAGLTKLADKLDTADFGTIR